MSRRRRLLAAAIAAAVVLASLLALRTALQPARVTAFALDAAGRALGLEITATGIGEVRLRGTPTLVAREVVARQPGAATPVLRADRLLLSLPWSTLRDRVRTSDFVRVELDAPVLDAAALSAWLASRPPGDGTLPRLRDGIHVRNGRIDGDGWRVEALALEVPLLAPATRVRASARGTFVRGTLRAPFDLALAATRPALPAGVGVVGTLSMADGDMGFGGALRASGAVAGGDGVTSVKPLRVSLAGDARTADTVLPLRLAMRADVDTGGAPGPRARASASPGEGTRWRLSRLGLALRAGEPLADVDAGGAMTVDDGLELRLSGRLQRWPAAWPALPPPLSASPSPLPFALRYAGAPDFSDPLALRLRRDDAAVDLQARVADVLAWTRAPATSPLPPLTGSARASRLQIAGATLEGVTLRIDDDDDVEAAVP